jgi:hypothetical protein
VRCREATEEGEVVVRSGLDERLDERYVVSLEQDPTYNIDTTDQHHLWNAYARSRREREREEERNVPSSLRLLSPLMVTSAAESRTTFMNSSNPYIFIRLSH